MDTEIQEFIKNMETATGTGQTEIDKLLSLKVQFPDDFIEFMKVSNGAEGPVGEEGYLSISSIEEIISINSKLKSSDLESQILLFASDGAGTWYAFRKGSSTAIVEVDLYDLSSDAINFISFDFKNFLKFVANKSTDD